MEDLFHKINMVLKDPTLEDLLALFDEDGYIRLNRVYLSPFSLHLIKSKLDDIGLVSWQINPNGLLFQFRKFRIKFYGSINVVIKQKLFCIEIDFDPSVDDNSGMATLKEIENYLKQCDAFFFMTYFFDIDKEILNNSLADSAEFLYKKATVRK